MHGWVVNVYFWPLILQEHDRQQVCSLLSHLPTSQPPYFYLSQLMLPRPTYLTTLLISPHILFSPPHHCIPTRRSTTTIEDPFPCLIPSHPNYYWDHHRSSYHLIYPSHPHITVFPSDEALQQLKILSPALSQVTLPAIETTIALRERFFGQLDAQVSEIPLSTRYYLHLLGQLDAQVRVTSPSHVHYYTSSVWHRHFSFNCLTNCMPRCWCGITKCGRLIKLMRGRFVSPPFSPLPIHHPPAHPTHTTPSQSQ